MTLKRVGLTPVDLGRVLLANGSEDDTLIYIVPRLCVGPLCVSNMQVSAGVQGLLGTDFLRAAHARVEIANGVMTIRAGTL
jgi:hypothetical protein